MPTINEEEEQENPVKRRALPDITSWDKILTDETIVKPKEIIHGVLYKGCKLVFGGPSKAKKSWVLMDLAWAVANGTKWMNFLQCSQGNVLYINFELIPWDTKVRGRILANNFEELKHVDMWNLRGYAEDIENLYTDIVEKVDKKIGGYDLLVIDPVYKTLGDRDENSAGHMTDLLNHLDKIAMITDTSIAFGAHFPKGNVGGRVAMDRIAGSGVFARDPDTIITMSHATKKKYSAEEGPVTEVEIENLFNVDFVFRSFKEHPIQTVQWKFPRMEPTKFTAKTTGSKGRTAKTNVEEVFMKIAAAMPVGLTKAQLAKACGCNQKTIQKLTAILAAGFNGSKISRDNEKTPWKVASKSTNQEVGQSVA